MRILPFLIIAGVAAGESYDKLSGALFDVHLLTHTPQYDSYTTASNLRGEDETRELQTVIYGNSRGRGRTRSSGTALFIVEDDNDKSTLDCADEAAAVFEDDFDDVFIGKYDKCAFCD